MCGSGASREGGEVQEAVASRKHKKHEPIGRRSQATPVSDCGPAAWVEGREAPSPLCRGTTNGGLPEETAVATMLVLRSPQAAVVT